MRLVVMLFGGLVAVSACAGADENEADMSRLGSDLTYLSAAVDAQLLAEPGAARLSDEELLARSTAHDPQLRAPFSRHSLQIQRQGADTSILVCTSDGTRGLLEDAGCTARLAGC